MLLDENGLEIKAFEPALAEVLGNAHGEAGHHILAQTIQFGRAQVQYRDWLFCLAQTSGTLLRKRLIDQPGQLPERFVRAIEDGFDITAEPSGFPPTQLTAQTVAPDILLMLSHAEQLRQEYQRPQIDDALLTLALLEKADDDLTELLTLWATAEGLQSFCGYLRAELGPREGEAPEVFYTAGEQKGEINPGALAPGGRKFCQRLSEDAASIGAKKITSRHLLYTLLGRESAPLAVSLAMRGVDVKRDLHALLARELAQPGRKRNEEFKLTRAAVFDGVAAVLEHGLHLARERGANAIAEFDLARAFVHKQAAELARLFPPEKTLDLPALRAYLDAADLTDDEADNLPIQRFSHQEIREQISRRVLGQEAAIARVMPWIKRLRFGLPRDGRPAGVFLFLGPTGTGKTQLAKELARYVYGDEEMMIFLEMGQFQSKESMSMFIGAPPGYVGYGDGKLTNGLRDKPECVVLFDEIEKANTQVFDTLLRFADEGVISDPAGPVRDGRKCIIVLTTNAGQAWLREHLKGHSEARNDSDNLSSMLFDAAMREMESKGFRPEFLGRVDERICFLPFTLETCRAIVESVLKRELAKFRELKGITITVSDEALQLMARQAHARSLNEGARGAPRAVNEFIVTPAIDLLSELCDENGAGGPTELIAETRGEEQIEVEVLR